MNMTVDGLHAFNSSKKDLFDKRLSPDNIRKNVISYWLNENKIPL